ncbi:tyrosine-type recombinase/integrase [Massilia orientalis]|uniref:Tyrosine-type recombinase/integrase n=1 Tax=Massilia orientalis TaxID=3050128 RepID=A0ACC7MLH6_9BURK|nr:integrase arm-type DNA-binding domain-containing protein [Massilia sp. YIM B02787]
MPKQVQPLTQLQVRNAKAKDKPYKLADGGGLYLEVMPSGGKLWRMKFRQADGKENRLAFGAFPDVSLLDARAKRDEARQLLAAGTDPARARAEQARQARLVEQNTFEHVARDWHRTMINKWQPQTAEEILRRFESDIFPAFGHLPINKVQAPDVLDAIRAIEQRGALEIANRQTANCSRVFKYAIRCGLAERNPAEFLREVLQPREKGHFAAISADGLPEFLRALYTNEACMGVPTHISMRLILLVFVRTSELIETPWAEIDLEKGEWIIPWKRMKRGKRRINPDKTDHHVCLSRQALALLRDLNRHTGGGTYLFPNLRDPKRPMSNNTLLKAIERMGYKGDMTGHGFRALAMSTLKENLGYRHEVVDRQLAHAQKDKLESAYDWATYLEERRKMMQCWADYIDRVTADAMRAPPGRSDNSMP